MTMEGPIGAADRREIVPEQPPLAYPVAVRALAGCFVATARLVRRRRMHLPSQRVGMRLRFADGTSARILRETVVDRGATADPCVLVVEFRLRAVRGRGHAAFRRESLLNTPLFAGFPGFVSKLWLADDERGRAAHLCGVRAGRVRRGVEVRPGDPDLRDVPAQHGDRFGRSGLADHVPPLARHAHQAEFGGRSLTWSAKKARTRCQESAAAAGS